MQIAVLDSQSADDNLVAPRLEHGHHPRGIGDVTFHILHIETCEAPAIRAAAYENCHGLAGADELPNHLGTKLAVATEHERLPRRWLA